MDILTKAVVAGLLVWAVAPATARAEAALGAEARLAAKNITLPAPSAPRANFVGTVQVGNLLFVSGHTSGPQWEPKGKVGKDVSLEQAYQAARHAGLITLSTMRAALGNLDRVKRVVKVSGMVNSADGFDDQPKVVNGFSDLLVEVFGETIGKHARTSVGVAGLPFNSPVEVEIIVELD